MAHYYMTGRPLPANASVLHRVCRCTTDADRSAVDHVLAEFFTLEGEIYRHGRIDRELAKAVDISEKRRAAANSKHHKAHPANTHANAVQMHSQPQPQSQQTSTHPNPPSPRRTDSKNQKITVRDRRALNDLIYEIQRDPRIDYETALRTACAQLTLPVDLALEMAIAAGMELTGEAI
jgi:uncharacterized protein YdaU (DUF1376 family)